MKKSIFTVIILMMAFASFSQVYNIKDSTIVFTCQGTFVDQGGSAGAYGPNQFYQLTVCSADAVNTFVKTYFQTFDVDPSDTLYIFDGMTPADPLVGKFNNNNSLTLTPVWASINNMTGCLTFMFITDGANGGAGWLANFSCIEPCQRLEAGIDTAHVFPAMDSNYIDVCFGDTVTFTGNGIFPQNDLAYHQANDSCHFYWNFGDNTVDSGRIVKHVYDSTRGYDVTLRIVDQRGCNSYNALGIRVRVAGNPIKLINQPPSICLGDMLTLKVGYNPGSTVSIAPISHHQNSSLKYDSTTFIPDGGALGGMCYNTNVTFNCFNPGQLVTQPTDISSVCVNMEHSFIGDLEMKLICPNGQFAIMKKYIHTGGAYLGIPCGAPNDNSTACDCTSPPACLTNPAMNPQGTGWTYCWSMSATYDTMNAYCNTGNITVPYTMLDSGFYKPSQTFNSLIGCPLNGTWNLQVCDYWAIDNGYVFWWQLNLNEALLPMNWGYDVYMNHAAWSGQGIMSSNDSTVQVKPVTAGNFNYNVVITDDFGCTYDTNVMVHVKPLPVPDLPPDTTVCTGTTVNIQATGGGTYHWSTGATTAGISVTPNDTTTYLVTVTNNACVGKDTMRVNVNPVPVANAGPDTSVCLGQSLTLTGAGGQLYHWNTGANTKNITISPANTNTYFLTVTSYNCFSKDSVTVTINPLPHPYLGNDTSLCNMDTLWINPGFSFTTYLWPDNSTLPSFPATTTGSYTVLVTNQYGCPGRDTISLVFNKTPDIQFFGDPLQGCQPLVVNFNSIIDPAPQLLTWKFGDGATSSIDNTFHTYYNSGTYTVTLTAVTGAGCEKTVSYPAYVHVWRKPMAKFLATPDMASIIDPRILFLNYSENASSYLWDYGDGTTGKDFSPMHIYTDTGQYFTQLLATSDKGCVDSASGKVIIRDFFTIYIPNAFSPNGDGVNDYFGPSGANWGPGNQYEMYIYNRWGALIYHTTDPSQPWNGTKDNAGGEVCQPGVYVYLIKLHPYNENMKKYTGNVTLLR